MFHKTSFQKANGPDQNCFHKTTFSAGLYFSKNSFQRNFFKGTFFKGIVSARIPFRGTFSKELFSKELFQQELFLKELLFEITISMCLFYFIKAPIWSTPAIFDCFFSTLLHFFQVPKSIISCPNHLSKQQLHSIKQPFFQTTIPPNNFSKQQFNSIKQPLLPCHNSTKPQHIHHFTTLKPQPLPDSSSMFSLWNRLMSLPFHYFTVPLLYHSATLPFHYSTIPLLYHSTTLPFHYSTIPLLYCSKASMSPKPLYSK